MRGIQYLLHGLCVSAAGRGAGGWRRAAAMPDSRFPLSGASGKPPPGSRSCRAGQQKLQRQSNATAAAAVTAAAAAAAAPPTASTPAPSPAAAAAAAAAPAASGRDSKASRAQVLRREGGKALCRAEVVVILADLDEVLALLACSQSDRAVTLPARSAGFRSRFDSVCGCARRTGAWQGRWATVAGACRRPSSRPWQACPASPPPPPRRA